MAEQPVQAGAPKRARSKAAAAAVALFPLLVSAGVLAPGLVQLALQVGGAISGGAPGGPGPGPFDHQPLPAPRDPALVFTPVSVELDRLFFESLFRGAHPVADGTPGARGPAPDGTPAFPRHDADGIASDERGNQDAEVVFADALVPKQAPEAAMLDLGKYFLPLCSTLPAQNCLVYDDFTRVSPNAAVPEPASAPLLAVGLLLLAARRRS